MIAPARALALALALALPLPGCSVLFMDKPSARPNRGSYPQCSDSSAAPTVDLLFSALYLLSAAGAVSDSLDDGLSSDDQKTLAVLLGLSAVLAVSGGYGVHWRHLCAEQRDAWTAPPPYAPPHPRPRAPVGARGGACYGNGTCNPGFICHPNAHLCVPGSNGLEGGACFSDGSCSDSLQCAGGLCVRPPPPECRVDANCPAGRECHGGYCIEPAAP